MLAASYLQSVLNSSNAIHGVTEAAKVVVKHTGIALGWCGHTNRNFLTELRARKQCWKRWSFVHSDDNVAGLLESQAVHDTSFALAPFFFMLSHA